MRILIATAAVAALWSGTATAAPAAGRGTEHSLIMSADADKDGKVTREELLASRKESFTKLDRNGDGVLNDKDRRAGIRGRLQARAAGADRQEELRKQFDADGDGSVSRAEFEQGPTPLFDEADANGDDVIDASEAKAAKGALAAAPR